MMTGLGVFALVGASQGTNQCFPAGLFIVMALLCFWSAVWHIRQATRPNPWAGQPGDE